MGAMDNFRRAVLQWLVAAEMPADERERLTGLVNYRAYAAGDQRRQLKVKPQGGDDNIVVNWLGLVVERSIAMLYGDGIKFALSDGTADFESSDDEDEGSTAGWIERAWTANRPAVTLYRLAQFGAVYGTCYAKIVPAGATYRGAQMPRLVPLHPLWMRVETDPEDMDLVRRYVCQYVFTGLDNQRRERRETTERQDNGAWLITSEVRRVDYGSGQWERDAEPVTWEYGFPPIHHWQNLPDAESVYGRSDIADALEPQDRYNFVTSNTSKIIRNHAHPKTFGKMLGALSGASWGADEMITAATPEADVKTVEMQSDLASSRAFALDLRQSIFDLTRTVDVSSLADKLGSLTNFGLRVLFMDALNKNHVKRLLYGDGLSEVNRRLLVVGGQAGEADADGGAVLWPDPLPTNALESAQAVTSDLGNGIVSKATASEARGYSWDEEQQKLAEESATSQTVGALALRDFLQGGGPA